MSQISKCPKCKKLPLDGAVLVCDNDCGTVFCEFCQFEWYEDINTHKKIPGHFPSCSEQNSDSEYMDNDSEKSESFVSESNASSNYAVQENRKSESSNGSDSDSNSDSNSNDSYQIKLATKKPNNLPIRKPAPQYQKYESDSGSESDSNSSSESDSE